MNSRTLYGAKKVANRYDGAKCTTRKQATGFYRESPHAVSSNSEDSSGQNSVCNDSDYQTSVENDGKNYCRPKNSRDEIAEQLANLQICSGDRNSDKDSGTVDDLSLESDLQSHSIIAGYSPANIVQQNSIQSLCHLRYSTILAGRLDSKDDAYAVTDERSLLNIAINESAETNNKKEFFNAETSSFLDSLEVRKDEVSSSGRNEKDSLEIEDYRTNNKPENEKALQFFLNNNNENVDPNSQEPRKRGQPRIIMDEIVKIPIKLCKPHAENILAYKSKEPAFSKPVSKSGSLDRKQRSSSLESRENRFEDSLMGESEYRVIADIKTPNVKAIRFIEDCCKSSPKVGVNVDTFGSELLTDVSNLSALGEAHLEGEGKNKEGNINREQIFKKLSQQFAKAPTEFTKQLLAIVDNSILAHSKSEYPDNSGVNLSRLTQEFRKLCQNCGGGIKDESMPSYFSPPSLSATNIKLEESAATPFHDFTKFGGGKKVYRKTPKRVLLPNGNTICGTPNCANIRHRGNYDNSCSPKFKNITADLNSTASFIFWENLCFQDSPTKQSMSKSSQPETMSSPTYEDLIRKSDQQMASLDQSILNGDSEIFEKNSIITAGNFKDHYDSMRQKFVGNLSSPSTNGNDKVNESIQQILTSRLIEKRRKCFEEARKVFESEENKLTKKNAQSPNKVSSGSTKKTESSKDCDNETNSFVRTLSACIDYFDYVRDLQSHKHSLYNIMECSEHSEQSSNQTSETPMPVKYVEAVILPVQKRAKCKPEKEESSSSTKNLNQIAQTYLYVSGTPRTPNDKSPSKSPMKDSSRSPGRRSSTVVSKKIKSPVSLVRRRVPRVAIPASHTNAPRTPTIIIESHVSEGKKMNSAKCTPHIPSSSKSKSSKDSSGLTDVTNTKRKFVLPKLVVTNYSPLCDSEERSRRLKTPGGNGELDCQKKLNFSDKDHTPELDKRCKYFFTPGKTPTYGRVKQNKKFFDTPKTGGKQFQNKLPPTSPGSRRVNYNTVQSPIAMYIRGTDPNLIKNVRGKTNEKMLTPKKTPKSKSKVQSPILARSPCMSPKSTETSRLKFQLMPARKQIQQESDLLNIALCESDPPSNTGSGSTSQSPFPKIFYKPAPRVKMVKENSPQIRCQKVLGAGMEEKIVYRHEGRLKSAKKSEAQNIPTDGDSKDTQLSCDSGDVSLLHQIPAVKSNYLLKK